MIYVGCGERAWHSMNNQEGNTQSNDGTWYALRVVNVKGDAGAVNDMIDALPSASAVKYSNYQQFVDAVAAARTVYDTLDDAAKKAVDPAKLAKLEEFWRRPSRASRPSTTCRTSWISCPTRAS